MNKIIIPAAGFAGLANGKIELANENAFADTFLSQPLTEYVVGWMQDHKALLDILELLAPKVRAARRFEFRAANTKNAFAAAEADQDVRASGAEFNTYKETGDILQAKTLSKGLTKIVDNDDLQQNPMALEEAAAEIMAILIRSEIIRAVTVLNAAATNNAKTWAAGADADADLLSALIAAGDDSGLQPNRVVFGATAWQKRVLALRGSDKAAGRTASLTDAELAAFLGVDLVKVIRERYQGADAKRPLVTSNLVFLFNAQAGAGKNDPSNIKRFVTPVTGGDFAVFQEKKAATTAVTVSHYSNVVLTSSLGVQKITVS